MMRVETFDGQNVIHYEHPLNERVRTYLRAEHLLNRFDALFRRDEAIDHHFALITLFEIIEVGGRSDLKSEMLKELERYKMQLNAYRDNPSVAQGTLSALLTEIDEAFQLMSQQSSRLGQGLAETEWVGALRNRTSIPGGTCSFDLPAYHAWQQRGPDARRAELLKWAKPLEPLNACTSLLLRLLRDNGVTQRVMATKGQYQQNLPQGRYQLMRLMVSSDPNLVPEVSGNRMMAWVRFQKLNPQGQLEPCQDDVPFDVELCG